MGIYSLLQSHRSNAASSIRLKISMLAMSRIRASKAKRASYMTHPNNRPTACRRGHEYKDGTWYWQIGGTGCAFRRCRECDKMRRKSRKEKHDKAWHDTMMAQGQVIGNQSVSWEDKQTLSIYNLIQINAPDRTELIQELAKRPQPVIRHHD